MRGKIRIPRLSTGGKILGNGLLCLLLALYLWQVNQFPVPTKQMNFRRMEHRWMLPEGELVLAQGELFVDEGQGQAVVGEVWSRRLPTWRSDSCTLWICPLEEGPSPVALPDNQLLVVRTPKEADRATVTTLNQRGGQVVEIAQGEPVGNGRYRFAFEQSYQAKDSEFSSRCPLEGWPYILRLYGQDGAVLLEQEGVIPYMTHLGW